MSASPSPGEWSINSFANPFGTEVAPIVETDDEIRRYLAEAEIPPLLPSLAYITGDLSLLRDHLRPDAMGWPSPRAV